MGTGRIGAVCLFSLFGAFCATVCSAQVESEAHVVDGSGGWASNSAYRCLSAACQPGPVGMNSGVELRNASGFLSAFLLHPDLDNDADGIADEDDPDDDNDLLSDADELNGGSFDPQTPTDSMSADSDGDGSPDGLEAHTGTNPHDAASQLRITDVHLLPGSAVVTWTSREGYTYDLVLGPSVETLTSSGTVVSTVTATGGVGPWWETASSATNAVVLPVQFYGINVAP